MHMSEIDFRITYLAHILLCIIAIWTCVNFLPARINKASFKIYDIKLLESEIEVQAKKSPNSLAKFKPCAITHDESHANAESCILHNCQDNEAMIELLPEEQKMYEKVDIFTENYTVLSKTKLEFVKSDIRITTYSDRGEKSHGGDYFNSYVTDGEHALVAHDVVDLLNGTYVLKQKCRLESDRDFKLFILAERGAEQMQFYRTLLRSNKGCLKIIRKTS